MLHIAYRISLKKQNKVRILMMTANIKEAHHVCRVKSGAVSCDR